MPRRRRRDRLRGSLLFGLFTRLAAVLRLVIIVVAIATTKLPMLASKGFWAAAHDGRADWSMLVGLLLLLAAGSEAGSADERLLARRP